MGVHALRKLIRRARVDRRAGKGRGCPSCSESVGYKHGIPGDAISYSEVAPAWAKPLLGGHAARHLNGRGRAVIEISRGMPGGVERQDSPDLIEFLETGAVGENFSGHRRNPQYLTIAIGCTGRPSTALVLHRRAAAEAFSKDWLPGRF